MTNQPSYLPCPECGHVPDIAIASVTSKQLECARVIHAFIEKEGFGPSYDNIKDGLGLKAKSGITRLIDGLEERGWRTRVPFRAHSIRMLVVPPAVV